MPFSLEVANALIVVPDPEDAVLPSGDEVLALGGDVDGVEFAL